MSGTTPGDLNDLALEIDNRIGPLPGLRADHIARVLRRVGMQLAEHDRRVSELLAANTAEVERRREAEQERDEVRTNLNDALTDLRDELKACQDWYRRHEREDGPFTVFPPDILVPF